MISDIVERTNREISLLKMVSPETARALIARISELEDAINKHKSAAHGSNWTYSYYDKALYTVIERGK